MELPWYEIIALYNIRYILTDFSASRQDKRVLRKSKIIRIKFLSWWGMLEALAKLLHPLTLSYTAYFKAGWQKLCEGTMGLRQKVWTWTKSLSPNIRYPVAILRFVAMIRFVAIYTLFGSLWAKSAIFGQQCFLGKKSSITWYILHLILS